ncbi:MAG TPA: LuxR C-terminal-related transcriptional regulator [Acidimicrobiales bacterium]|nr:LuxR C-terminal-related transcriptional regulator [Acidimicrobiales bacterium]
MSETNRGGRPDVRLPRFPSSKFAAPKLPSHLVARTRLFERLDQGQRHRLTVVVGSPGAGKTVLVADWLRQRPERRPAWLSCDDADADPVRFVIAIIEALRRVGADLMIGEDALQLLSFDGEVSADVVAALADDLERSEGAEVLVIDDFHLAGMRGADTLALLLEYWPASLQLVVASRVDPRLRLARMRAYDGLVEVRDSDLFFSVDETRSFLSAFGVRIDEGDLALVYKRSEGWAVGLQMAAISIHDSPDPVEAAGRLELDRHTIVGYFLDEVLYRQPPEVVDFMLATSVLDELSAPLCTALCGEGAAPLLELLYRTHLFVTLVDEHGPTYRYHHLIKEVLRAELHARDPDRERQLHAAAASYLVEAGEAGPAARHLLAAGEPEAAFNLLSDRVVGNYYLNPKVGSALDLDELQPEPFGGNPAILVPLATELFLRGAYERGSRAFTLARQADVDPDRQPELAVKLAFATALQSGATGQLDQIFEQRDRARHLASRAVGVDEWLDGLDVVAMQAHALAGNYREARELAAAIASAQRRAPLTQVLCPGVISQVALAEGELEEAEALSQGSLASARRLGIDGEFLPTWARRTTALLALERHDLEAADRLTEQILGRLGSGRPNQAYLAQLDRARIWASNGNLDAALSSLPAARATLRYDHSIMLAQADELEARLRLALGDRNGALSLTQRLPEDRRRVMLATVALASGSPEGARDYLGDPFTKEPTVRSDLELRLLRVSTAIAETSPQAPRLVKEVLAITDRHGFVETVLDSAPHLVEHLITHSDLYPATDNLRALIAGGLEARKRSRSRSTTKLADPLTAAEIRVLQTLPTRGAYVNIASDLHLSINTVKTHLNHIYMKLGVTSRSAAIERALALGFL